MLSYSLWRSLEFPKLSMDCVLSCLQDFCPQSGPSYYPSLPGPPKKLPLFCIPHNPFPYLLFPTNWHSFLVLYYFYNHFWIRLYFLVFFCLFVFVFAFSFLFYHIEGKTQLNHCHFSSAERKYLNGL